MTSSGEPSCQGYRSDERLAAETVDLGGVGAEVDVGVVDEDLGDDDGIRACVANAELDLAGAEDRPLDGEILDRRPAPVTERIAAEGDERNHGADDECQRDQPRAPTPAGPPGCRCRPSGVCSGVSAASIS